MQRDLQTQGKKVERVIKVIKEQVAAWKGFAIIKYSLILQLVTRDGGLCINLEINVQSKFKSPTS